MRTIDEEQKQKTTEEQKAAEFAVKAARLRAAATPFGRLIG